MVNEENLKKGQERAKEILSVLYFLRGTFEIAFATLKDRPSVPGSLEMVQRGAFHCEGLITYLENGSKKADELLKDKK
jgi:hypothetical protein